MRKLIILILVHLSFSYCYANNIKVENVELKDQNSVNNTVMVEFDLSWENSWRTTSGPKNYDAAWVFIKYRTNSGPWQHSLLSYTDGQNDGHTAPSGSTIHTASDQTGCFIFRSSNGSGNNDWDNVQLSWNYGALDDDAQVDVQVFAVEMVYIPQESFYLGGGSGDEVNKFYNYPFIAFSFIVNSESAITIGTTNGNLYYANSSGSGGDQTGTLAASYPKGFNAFYSMKYELTEGQWVSFFNTLTPTQKMARDITSGTGKNTDDVQYQNSISWLDGSNAATTSTPETALNYTSVADIMAYMDWAGLRPMTELEYEKSCRGPAAKVANDFAWGNANILSGVNYLLENSDTPTSYISNPAVSNGNACYSLTHPIPDGPLRVGIFAASAVNKNREETGASYYGLMEMSGNLYERVITVGNINGRNFTGLHGNGYIDTSGNSNVLNWPNGSTGAGFSYRGASWLNIANFLRVSDRYDGATNISSGNNRLGARCVRTAEI